MPERTPVSDGIDVALWRGGIGDGSEARRASSLYVAIFLLWPLAAIAAGLVSLLLAWFGRFVAQMGFLVTFGSGLLAPFVWQWWERSLWRARRRAARVQSFLPLGDLSELAVLEDGQPVRVRGRVRARSAFVGAAAPAGAVADTVYEQVQARPGTLGPEVWYELGCDFEIVDQAGQSAFVHLATAQVLPRRLGRARVRGRDVIERVLSRLPVSDAVAAGLGTLVGPRMAARVHVIRAGDEVEIMACKLPSHQRAVLHRESALRPAIGAHAGIAPLVIVRDGRGPRA
ncbi:MAG TPA: hypothetical protein VNM90_19975 [Haliangium sp.]|nr:hypothetical protein [Haliangium sp.]